MQPLILPSEALSCSPIAVEQQDIVSENKSLNYHYFMVGNIGFLIDETYHCEVTDNQNICEIPLTPLWFKGVINLRGNCIPVADLGEYYDIEKTDYRKVRKTYILTIGNNKDIYGVQLSTLPYKVSLEDPKIITHNIGLPKRMTEQLECVYESNGIWAKINVKQFFTSVFSELR